MLVLALLLATQAELVVTNARVYTADVNRPTAEAFAVREGRIAFDGTQPELERSTDEYVSKFVLRR